MRISKRAALAGWIVVALLGAGFAMTHWPQDRHPQSQIRVVR